MSQKAHRVGHGKPIPRDPEEQPPVQDGGNPPPHDLECEATLLAAVIIDPEAIDEVADFLRPEHFYSEAHRRIFEACLAVRAAGSPIDTTLVATWLRDHERLAQIGGFAYIMELLNARGIANPEAYGRIIHTKARLRGLILACQKIAARGYLPIDDADTFIEEAEAEIFTVASDVHRSRTVPIRDAARAYYAGVQSAAGQERPPGIATGLDEYDNKTAGYHRGDVTLLAARPGMGKTAYALCVGINVAATPPPMFAEDGRPGMPQGVAIFSMEMPEKQITQRLFAIQGRISAHHLRRNQLNGSEWSAFTGAYERLSSLPLVIDDEAGLNPLQLRAKVRRIRAGFARTGVRLTLVVVDYIQLMKGATKSFSREQEIAEISRSLKTMAKEEDVAVLALAQLNREAEKRTGAAKRPVVSDLRESGSLEQDADNIGFLYRPEFYGESVMDGDEGKTEIIIAKQRNGPQATVTARWSASCTRFDNM